MAKLVLQEKQEFLRKKHEVQCCALYMTLTKLLYMSDLIIIYELCRVVLQYLSTYFKYNYCLSPRMESIC